MNLAGLIVCLAGFAMVWRISCDWRDVYGRRLDIAERLIETEEANTEAVDRAADLIEEDMSDESETEMPQELKQRIYAWEDDWAQEDQRRTIMELYRKFRRWDLVIANLPSA